ncbi:MAG: hypothetical protein K2Q09_00425, partial [Phycisphaerales bacterium]|nr:hypothetical protein [Phycisphaerales bacterium]
SQYNQGGQFGQNQSGQGPSQGWAYGESQYGGASAQNGSWHHQPGGRMNGGQSWGYTQPQGGQMQGGMGGPAVLAAWPMEQRQGLDRVASQYGPPDELTQSFAVWHDRGPFQTIKVHREAVSHSVPVQHQDFMEHSIAYKVPAEKVGDLSKFDGSLVVNRTKGCVAATCDSEAHNLLALNLANDIVTGKRSVSDAKDYMAKAISDEKSGRIDKYMKGLAFQPQSPMASADPGDANK